MLPKKIKLYAEYGCWPIWGVDEIYNAPPEELSLHQERLIVSMLGKRIMTLHIQVIILTIGVDFLTKKREWFGSKKGFAYGFKCNKN